MPAARHSFALTLRKPTYARPCPLPSSTRHRTGCFPPRLCGFIWGLGGLWSCLNPVAGSLVLAGGWVGEGAGVRGWGRLWPRNQAAPAAPPPKNRLLCRSPAARQAKSSVQLRGPGPRWVCHAWLWGCVFVAARVQYGAARGTPTLTRTRSTTPSSPCLHGATSPGARRWSEAGGPLAGAVPTAAPTPAWTWDLAVRRGGGLRQLAAKTAGPSYPWQPIAKLFLQQHRVVGTPSGRGIRRQSPPPVRVIWPRRSGESP
jgi:hypothetical protein